MSFRGVRLTVAPHRDNRSGRIGWRFSWPDPAARGGRRYRRLPSKKAALDAARAKARELAGRDLPLARLPAEERRILAAVAELAPTWEDVATWRALKGGAPRPLGEMVAAFVADKAQQKGRMTHHLVDVRNRLREMAGFLGVERAMGSVGAADLARWLGTYHDSAARHNDRLEFCISLWKWAMKRGHLPPAAILEPARLDKRDTGVDSRPIVTVRQAAAILEAVTPEFLPWAVLAMFSGCRAGEIFMWKKPPLEWSQVRFSQDVIVMRADQAKGGRRRIVTLHPTARAWLEPIAASGPILRRPASGTETTRLRGLLGGWERNWLRHSYASYRLAECHDLARVAIECGNSEQMLREHYWEAVDSEAAQSYFALTPGEVNRKGFASP